MTKSELRLTHVAIIKQFYYSAGFVGDEFYKGICDKLEKSNIFRVFKWPEKNVFSTNLREGREIFRTFEMKNGLKVLDLHLITTRLSGQIRILVTIYRAGFAVLSLIHSIIPEKKEGDPKGKNLTSTAPLTSIDINYLLEEEKTPTRHVPIKYEVELHKTSVGMSSSDLIEYVLKNLEEQGLSIKKTPRKITRITYCWGSNLTSKKFSGLIKENYEDLYIMFATPKGARVQKSKKFILEDLKSHVHFYSEKRGFFFDSNSMLVISPRKTPPYSLVHTQLPWIFQLVSLEEFLLKLYSLEVRKLAPKLVSATSGQYPSLLEQIIKLRERFSLVLEDLYWVESDLFRIQAAKLVSEYKKDFELEEMLATLQKRFDWIQSRCTEALKALEHRLVEKREKSITKLTLIFATFGLGEILSTFLVWYFGYLPINGTAANSHWALGILILGLTVTFLVVFVVFLISNWYATKTVS